MDNDCTPIVEEHKKRVAFWLRWLVQDMEARITVHDNSKLQEPEKAIFDVFAPMLDKQDNFGTPEYEEARRQMGTALAHHYSVNRHHPEYHKHGISGMTIMDLLEMFADFMAATSSKSHSMNLEYLQERFDICPQLVKIFANTLYEADLARMVNEVPDDVSQKVPFLSAEQPTYFGKKDV